LTQEGGRRQKVSIAAALWLPPRRVLKELSGRVVVVGDGGSMHEGDPIAQLQDLMADRLSLEKFPPYTPMDCPEEPLWSWLKYSRLCSYALYDASELDGCVVAEPSAIRDDQELLRGFVKRRLCEESCFRHAELVSTEKTSPRAFEP
jgi:hypothetical protein